MTSRKFLSVFLLLSDLTILSSLPGYGQAFEATLTGIVTDITGAIVPGVTVTVTNQKTNVTSSALTNDQGYYTIVGLSPGEYEVRAELPGFKTSIQRDIDLLVEQVARIDIRMEVGEITEQVEVIGQAPILNTETSSKGQVVTHEEIVDFPLEGRDFNELAFLTIGVIPKNQGGQGGFANINGARSDSINFIVDGGNNNILRGGAATVRPALDSIQEFKVQTSNYSAEYGRRSTGVINMVLRSGTNDFHGVLFDFHRNSALDAANFFDPVVTDAQGNYLEKDKSVLIRNNFGGNIGGPIVRDKAFFFFNFEGMRRREGQTRLGRVPTLLERQGDFSESTSKLKDPISGKNFQDSRIPADRIHPLSSELLEFYPTANRELREGFNFISNKVDVDDFNDFVTKFDFHFAEGDSLSVRYLLNDRDISNPFGGEGILPGFGDVGRQRFQMIGFNYTHTFSPTLVSQAMAAFARKNDEQSSINARSDFAGQLGIEGVTGDPALFGFPRVTVRGFSPLGDANNMPVDWTENDYHFSNTVTWIQGGHSLKFGGDVIRTQFFQLFANNARGVFNFLGRWTGEPFADFVLGMLNNTNRRIKQTKNYLFNSTYAGFVQDDWKIRRNLTLNLGVRYDLFLPPSDKFGNWSNFDPAVGKLIISGTEGYPKSLVYADRNNLAPRVGFAWRPFGTKTVIRAGYGMFFGLSLLNPIRLSLGANPPFTILETFSRLAKDPLLLTWDSPFPSQRASIADVNSPEGYELRPNTGNLHQYNLTIEHQLPHEVVFEVSYLGSKGTHLGRRFNLNQPIRSKELADAGLPFPRPYEGFGSIEYYAFEADSNYHAFQTGLRKRGRGINFRLNYSLSKSIDDASRLNGSGDGGFAGVQDSLNRHLERGLSDFDRRHAFVGSILYKLPFNGHLLTRDWQVNTIVRLYSGTPFTPQLANFDFNLGEAKRPDRLGSGKLDQPTRERWFNTADFVPVLPGEFRFGNSGRNVLIGPPERHWSFSLMRDFQMPKENQRLQLRWEIFNLANFTNFFMPEENIDVPQAATISRAEAARQMQVALKYFF